ncbi:hypothetical protein SSBG_03457 [Streptomyces sp. SPB074]|nr:hypothetical protein SSBG_03457 [Streptomyces sp. SPB074]
MRGSAPRPRFGAPPRAPLLKRRRGWMVVPVELGWGWILVPVGLGCGWVLVPVGFECSGGGPA